MPELNYKHLYYFWSVAHAGSLTKAASALNTSQSALSVQIKQLEEQLGHPLFLRAHRRLELTEAGEMALDYANTVFAAGRELKALLAGKITARQRIFRAGALTTLSRNFQLTFLQPLVSRPDVELVIHAGAWRDLLDQLENHSLDVVLANSPAPPERQDKLQSHLLNTQSVSLVGHPDLAQAAPLIFPDCLRAIPVLLPSRESGIRAQFDQAITEANIQPTILAEVDDMAMLRLLARASHALTLVPRIVVADELAAGVLVEHCQISSITERFYALTPRRRFPNPLLAELLRPETAKSEYE